MTDTTTTKSASWTRRAIIAIAIVAAWELVRPVGVEVVNIVRGQCPGELVIGWSRLNCEEYPKFADAIDEAGFDWRPGRHGAICVAKEDRLQLITRLAEMGRINPAPDARCPLP